MTPAPSAGGEGSKKKRNRRRSRSKSSKRPSLKKQPYAKRVDEISAGGLVIDSSGTKGLLIGRIDLKIKVEKNYSGHYLKDISKLRISGASRNS